MSLCDTCRREKCINRRSTVFGCSNYVKKVQTKADRIRAMSDEALAEFIILSPEMEFDVCLLCQFGNPTPIDDRGQCLSGYGACDAESRAEAFKKWLKQPAEV